MLIKNWAYSIAIYMWLFKYIFICTAIPIITLQPKGTILHTGTNNVNMTCSAIGHSVIMYHWEKYNTNSSEWSALPRNQQIDTSDISTYRLQMLTKEDDGVYRCVATNIDGSGYSKTATITVYGTYVRGLTHCNMV